MLRRVVSRLTHLTMSRPILSFPFSKWDEKDKLELEQHDWDRNSYQPYRKLVDLWQKPLRKKKLRQERIKEIKATRVKTEPQESKFIVHNAAAGIEYPVGKEDYFCVADIDGNQYKLMEDCRLTLDNRPDLKINDKVTYDKILLVASRDFTILGRPNIENAHIEATVEEKLQARKVIVFKKKRRKNYRKSYGFRAKLTVLRINKIVYQLP